MRGDKIVLLTSVFIAVIAMFHKDILWTAQKKLGISDRIQVGCAEISVDQDRFYIALLGDKRKGAKYFGIIWVPITKELKDYVLFSDKSGDSNIFISRMTKEHVRTVSTLLDPDVWRVKSTRAKGIYNRVDIGGFLALEGISEESRGFRTYTIPALEVSIYLENISRDEIVASVSKQKNCTLSG